MKKRSAREWEILKTNVLNHPEALSLFEDDDDDSFLALARRQARMMMLERDPAEDKAIIADLTGLAKVPPHLEARFRFEVFRAIDESRQRWISLGGPLGGGRNRAALRKAEQKVRDALYAVHDLHPVELEALYNAFLPRWISLDDDDDKRGKDRRRVTDLLSALLVALSEVGGRSPNRRVGARGRPKGDAGDWAFQGFVRTLWIAAHRCQGTLSAHSKDGAMLRALRRIKQAPVAAGPAEERATLSNDSASHKSRKE